MYAVFAPNALSPGSKTRERDVRRIPKRADVIFDFIALELNLTCFIVEPYFLYYLFVDGWFFQ